MKAKRGKHKTDFENEIFSLPVATNISPVTSKGKLYDDEIASYEKTCASIASDLHKEQLKSKQDLEMEKSIHSLTISWKKNYIFDKLIQPENGIDGMTCAFAQMAFKRLHEVLERAMKKQLPGGKFFEPTQELFDQSKSAIPHNKLPERVFDTGEGVGSERKSENVPLFVEKRVVHTFEDEKWNG
ncbi:unnamed protein product [Mytilus coruscus]|uniref:Uncharacterized protein n=1 Tax=Mytilus coruscus TaxID=42192 RepID=A0A6J8BSG1_MYTCO|nr:unnamed protein product [Mytilus coruscus]